MKENISEEETAKINDLTSKLDSAFEKIEEVDDKNKSNRAIESDEYKKHLINTYKDTISDWSNCRVKYFASLRLYSEIIDEYVKGDLRGLNDEQLPKSLWPITTQYDIPINEEKAITPEDAKKTYMLDLKPGDIQAGRYGSRFTTSEACD